MQVTFISRHIFDTASFLKPVPLTNQTREWISGCDWIIFTARTRGRDRLLAVPLTRLKKPEYTVNQLLKRA